MTAGILYGLLNIYIYYIQEFMVLDAASPSCNTDQPSPASHGPALTPCSLVIHVMTKSALHKPYQLMMHCLVIHLHPRNIKPLHLKFVHHLVYLRFVVCNCSYLINCCKIPCYTLNACRFLMCEDKSSSDVIWFIHLNIKKW